MAGLIAGGKRIVNIAFGAKGFPADRMHNRMTVAPDLWVFDLEPLNESEKIDRRMFA
jgi:hypothetical protein